MSNRILYFRGGILEAADELESADVVEATTAASSRRRHLTAEVWLEGRKVAVIGPSRNDALQAGN